MSKKKIKVEDFTDDEIKKLVEGAQKYVPLPEIPAINYDTERTGDAPRKSTDESSLVE